MLCALLGMPLIHKTSRNIFLQKLPILLHSNCFLQGKIAKARQCINRAIFEEKYFLKFYDVFSSWESTWSIKWVCEGCNTAEIFKIFKRQILTSLCTYFDTSLKFVHHPESFIFYSRRCLARHNGRNPFPKNSKPIQIQAKRCWFAQKFITSSILFGFYYKLEYHGKDKTTIRQWFTCNLLWHRTIRNGKIYL